MCKVSTGAGETKPEGLQFLSDTKPIALHILHFWRDTAGKVSTRSADRKVKDYWR